MRIIVLSMTFTLVLMLATSGFSAYAQDKSSGSQDLYSTKWCDHFSDTAYVRSIMNNMKNTRESLKNFRQSIKDVIVIVRERKIKERCVPDDLYRFFSEIEAVNLIVRKSMYEEYDNFKVCIGKQNMILGKISDNPSLTTSVRSIARDDYEVLSATLTESVILFEGTNKEGSESIESIWRDINKYSRDVKQELAVCSEKWNLQK